VGAFLFEAKHQQISFWGDFVGDICQIVTPAAVLLGIAYGASEKEII
jgi:hypothetical protein